MPSPPNNFRSRQTTRKKLSFDNCCPYCRHSIGWDVLAAYFLGVKIDPDRNLKKRILCPQCDSVLTCDVLIDFQLTEEA